MTCCDNQHLDQQEFIFIAISFLLYSNLMNMIAFSFSFRFEQFSLTFARDKKTIFRVKPWASQSEVTDPWQLVLRLLLEICIRWSEQWTRTKAFIDHQYPTLCSGDHSPPELTLWATPLSHYTSPISLPLSSFNFCTVKQWWSVCNHQYIYHQYAIQYD